MDDARRARLGRGPGNRSGERVVELERRRAVAPDPQPPVQAARQRAGRQQPRQHAGADRGHHRVGADLLAVREPHAGHAAAAHDHVGDRRVAADRRAVVLGAADQRVGDRAHPAARQRPAVAVAEQLQQQAERAAPGRRRRQPGVLGGAGQPRGRAPVAFEEVEPERLDRAGHPARPLQPVAAQRQRQPRRGPHRWERRENASDQRRRDRQQLLHRRRPAGRRPAPSELAVAADVAVQRDRAPVGERMRDDDGRDRPTRRRAPARASPGTRRSSARTPRESWTKPERARSRSTPRPAAARARARSRPARARRGGSRRRARCVPRRR